MPDTHTRTILSIPLVFDFVDPAYVSFPGAASVYLVVCCRGVFGRGRGSSRRRGRGGCRGRYAGAMRVV